jgi:hypothetical protein
MNRNRLIAGATVILAFVFSPVWLGARQAQNAKNPYPKMASLDAYLMPDRNAEIALARTAAPESISRDATVLVLTRHGYETAVKGRHGFVCLVERAWMSPFDSAEFWNPKERSPVCYNPPAVRSIVPIDYKRTELALAGKSKAELLEWTKEAYARRELPRVQPGAMCFMMSKQAYLTDQDGHNLAHLMFFTPLTKPADWGADVPNSPVITGDNGPPQPFTLFIVPVGKWSDGSPAPLPK